MKVPCKKKLPLITRCRTIHQVRTKVKRMDVLGIFVVFLFLVCISIFPCWVCRKRFEEVFAFSLMAGVLFVLFGGFARMLNAGVYVLLGWAVLSAAFALWKSGDKRSELLGRVFTPGFAVFCLVFVALFILSRNHMLNDWDEIAFWGPFAKETMRLGAFHNSAGSVVGVHLAYPPGSTLFEVLWMKLYGGYSEPQMYLSFHILCTAFLLPALRGVTWKQPAKLLFRAMLTVLLPGVMFSSYLRNVYPDVLMGLAFGYAMYVIYTIRRPRAFDFINIGVSCAFLYLVKDAGILFILVTLGALLVKTLFMLEAPEGKGFWRNRSVAAADKRTAAIGLAAACVIPVVIYVGWSMQIAHLPKQFAAGTVLKTDEIRALFDGIAPAYKYGILSYFTKSILTYPSVNALVSPSYVAWLVILGAALLAGSILFFKKGERKNINWLNLCLFAGGLLYALAMLMIYLFNFNEQQGSKLSSYSRYMNTYLMGYLLFFYLAACDVWETHGFSSRIKPRNETIGYVAAGLVVVFILTPLAVLHNALFNGRGTSFDTARAELKQEAEYVKEYVDLERDKVYFVIQCTRGYEYFVLLYETMPLKTNPNYSWSIGEPYVTDDGIEDTWTKKMDAGGFMQELVEGGYDYVYLVQTDGQFTRQFGALFPDGGVEGTLYRVQGDGTLAVVSQIAKKVFYREVDFGSSFKNARSMTNVLIGRNINIPGYWEQ